MLGEWVGWRRWMAIGAGFAGVLVVVRPGLAAAVGGAALGRQRGLLRLLQHHHPDAGAHDSSQTTLFYSNMLGAAIMLPVLPFVWTPPRSVLDGVLMVAMGGFGAFGHYLLIVAHRHAPASVLSPFIYIQLIWATTLGYLVFANVPNRWTLAGAAIVIASAFIFCTASAR
jgi:drug/metabolite transporter (DMT)-like permease